MTFLRYTLSSCLLLMVLVTLISKKFKNLFPLSYSMVYWIAGYYLEFLEKCLLGVLMQIQHDCCVHIV